jgi:putative Ca2+/H+ antiporter (TMEM165/GDT1 family)
MANLAARYHDPVAVGIGSVLGLWLVAALAITGGQGLLRILPPQELACSSKKRRSRRVRSSGRSSLT